MIIHDTKSCFSPNLQISQSVQPIGSDGTGLEQFFKSLWVEYILSQRAECRIFFVGSDKPGLCGIGKSCLGAIHILGCWVNGFMEVLCSKCQHMPRAEMSDAPNLERVSGETRASRANMMMDFIRESD